MATRDPQSRPRPGADGNVDVYYAGSGGDPTDISNRGQYLDAEPSFCHALDVESCPD